MQQQVYTTPFELHIPTVYDSDGTAVPSWEVEGALLDAIELGADDDSDPESWPAWTDERWELSPPIGVEDEPFEPTEADRAEFERWLMEEEEANDRLEAMALECERQDRLASIHGAPGVRDEDLAAMGLPVG